MARDVDTDVDLTSN